jgi:hypothetical protein
MIVLSVPGGFLQNLLILRNLGFGHPLEIHQEVAHGYDTDELAFFGDSQMPDTEVTHHVMRVLDRPERLDGRNRAGHDRMDRSFGEIAAFCNGTPDNIGVGDNADQVIILFD